MSLLFSVREERKKGIYIYPCSCYCKCAFY